MSPEQRRGESSAGTARVAIRFLDPGVMLMEQGEL